MRSALAFVLLFALAAPAVAVVEPCYDIFAQPDNLVEVSPKRRINLRCTGSGPVTVVFESRLAFPSYSWRKVQPLVAKFAKACSYDRAGLGFSDAGPKPRRAAAIAGDLRAVIDRADLRAPLVLVGNSMGSQSIRLYAFRHPEQIAGLVLVDPYVEGQNAAYAGVDPGMAAGDVAARANDRKCLALIEQRKLTATAAEWQGCIDAPDPASSARLKEVVRRQRLSMPGARSAFSEASSFDSISEDDIRRETRSLGDMPIVVLTAEAAFAGPPSPIFLRLLAEKRRLHRTLSALSSRGDERLVSGAGHVIQSTNPAAVASLIEEIVVLFSKSNANSPH